VIRASLDRKSLGKDSLVSKRNYRISANDFSMSFAENSRPGGGRMSRRTREQLESIVQLIAQASTDLIAITARNPKLAKTITVAIRKFRKGQSRSRRRM
jgi:hypothetical protein